MNILFIVFNRPDTTAKVFERIRRAKPERLFIAADGPRKDRPGEKELCENSRKIAAMVDWPCEIVTRFQEKNLGCKMHASGAATWFFQNVEEGIIIEDDCLPDPSFFIFCTELLERYRDDDKIMHINGTDFLDLDEIPDPSFSYRFSRCISMWGWATWRRSWEKYDIHMTHLDELVRSGIAQKMFLDKNHFRFWMKHCRHIGEKNIDTWDAQWQYSILYNDGYVVSPNVNMVENIGFGQNATHTKKKNKHIIPVKEMPIPIQHPKTISVDMKADANLMDKVYIRNLWKKIVSRLQ